MPPRVKEYCASVLVIDVGVTASGSGFLAQAVRCASEMVQRKIYAETNQRYGLVLVGTRKTDNKLNYPHVCVPKYSGCGGDLVTADFGLVKFIEEQVPSLSSHVEEGDWLDGAVVAMDRLVENTKDSPGCKSRNIIMLTDMGCKADDDKLRTINEATKREAIDFTFILPNWKEDDEMEEQSDGDGNSRKPKTKNQQDGCLIMERMSADFCQIETAHAILLSKERRKKRPFPWKVELEVGPDIRIPTTGYIRVRREAPKTWKKVLADRSADGFEVEELKAEATFVRENEDQEVVEPQDLIDAYKYGSEILAVSSVERDGAYEGGPKSLSLIGFAKGTEIPTHLLVGDGSMVFQPVEGDDYSIVALSALLEAMIEEGAAAIVRRVYRNGTAPKIGALIPEEGENHSRTLLYIELPYSEDLRHYQFAKLWNEEIKPTSEQLESVDALIDAMMVPPSAEENANESLDTENLLNPYYQHLYKCLTARALNPSKGKAPLQVDEYTKSIMQPSESRVEKASKVLTKIKELFKLEQVVQKKDKQTGAKLFGGLKNITGNGEPASKRTETVELAIGSDVVMCVGTATPADDFRSMLSRDFPLESVSAQMEKVLLDLLRASYGEQMVDKIVDCLCAYRRACVELKKSLLYNTFVRELKAYLLELQRGIVWKEIVAKNLGLISSDEEPDSEVSVADCKSFVGDGVFEEKSGDVIKCPGDDRENVNDLLEDL